MEKNLLRMLAAILTCGSMTLTSCVANDDNASGVEGPTFNVQQEDFKWDFKYSGKVYLDPRINKDLITAITVMSLCP